MRFRIHVCAALSERHWPQRAPPSGSRTAAPFADPHTPRRSAHLAPRVIAQRKQQAQPSRSGPCYISAHRAVMPGIISARSVPDRALFPAERDSRDDSSLDVVIFCVPVSARSRMKGHPLPPGAPFIPSPPLLVGVARSNFGAPTVIPTDWSDAACLSGA